MFGAEITPLNHGSGILDDKNKPRLYERRPGGKPRTNGNLPDFWMGNILPNAGENYENAIEETSLALSIFNVDDFSAAARQS